METALINAALADTGKFDVAYDDIRKGILHRSHPTEAHRKALYEAIKKQYEENRDKLR